MLSFEISQVSTHKTSITLRFISEKIYTPLRIAGQRYEVLLKLQKDFMEKCFADAHLCTICFLQGMGYGGRFAVPSRLEVHHSEGEGWQAV